MATKKNKVIVGMSGGVDSSAAAALLVDSGFDVVGLTITPFKIEDDCRTKELDKSCCTYQSVAEANAVCNLLGIEHKLVDRTDLFSEIVVTNFVNEYFSGRTPNPCVICNLKIKWNTLLQVAAEEGADFVATGHYARVRFDEPSSRYILSKSVDEAKDQSYFLWRLTQNELSKTIFPLGLMTKTQTRQYAKQRKLPNFDKAESQEICFVSSNDYRLFLNRFDARSKTNHTEGEMIFNGKIIGRHKGIQYYTIGQRKGLGVTHNKPLFVKDIIAETNTIIIAEEDELFNQGLTATQYNLIKSTELNNSVYWAKVRYRDPGSEVYCNLDSEGRLEVKFLKPRRAITPGQSVVVYDGEDVACGGVIESRF